MTKLYLVRHGPTHAKAMVGWSDLPADLSDTGAITRLSSHLPAEALVVSSDLIRAADTASALQGDRQRLPDLPGLREINFGSWELRTWSEVDAEDPKRIRAYWDTPGDTAPPNGESWNQVRARVDTAIDTLIHAYPDHELIVVGHFGQILTQLQRAGHLSATEAFGHHIDNLSVTEITHRANTWSIGAINHRP